MNIVIFSFRDRPWGDSTVTVVCGLTANTAKDIRQSPARRTQVTNRCPTRKISLLDI
jgi:hypothetical protein